MIRYPRLVWMTNIAESGRRKRLTLVPYDLRDEWERTTTARMTAGFASISVTPDIDALVY